jgi:hypothetical protein
MNDAFYYYSFKTKHHSSSDKHHSSDHKGKKHKVGHLEKHLKHDKNYHEALSIANEHNKKIKSHEASTKRARDRTRGHTPKNLRHHGSIDASFENSTTSEDPSTIAADKANRMAAGSASYAHTQPSNLNDLGYNTIMTDIIGQVKSKSYLFMDAGLAGIAALLLLPKIKINVIPSKLNKTVWTASLAALGIGIVGHMMNPTGRAFAVNIPPGHNLGGSHEHPGGDHHGGPPGGHGHPGGHEHPGGHFPGGDRRGHFPRVGFRDFDRRFRGFREFGYPGYPYDPYIFPDIDEGLYGNPYGLYGNPEGLYGYPDAPYDPYLFGGYPEFGVEEFGFGYPHGFEFGRGHFPRGHFPGGHGHPGGHEHPGGHFPGGHGHPGGGGGDDHHHGGPPGGGGGGMQHAGPPGGGAGEANLAYSYFSPAIFPELSYFNKQAYHYSDPRNGTRSVGPPDVILPKHIETGNYQHSSRAPIDDFNHMPPTLLSDIY